MLLFISPLLQYKDITNYSEISLFKSLKCSCSTTWQILFIINIAHQVIISSSFFTLSVCCYCFQYIHTCFFVFCISLYLSFDIFSYFEIGFILSFLNALKKTGIFFWLTKHSALGGWYPFHRNFIFLKKQKQIKPVSTFHVFVLIYSFNK